LFLGSRLAALNYEWLKDNVKYILNVTGEVQNYYEEDNEFVYMRVPVQDSYETPLHTHFEATAKFIQTALDNYAATPDVTESTAETTQTIETTSKVEETKDEKVEGYLL
jgi:outer membrane scaffolding protein for murein synthesis (MipA/OmpV family)